MTDVVAQDDTVTFEYNHASFSAFTYVDIIDKKGVPPACLNSGVKFAGCNP